VTARIVIGGLIGALIASGITGSPSGSLPGIALGSEPLLLVERAVAFFAAWMVFVVVVAQALKGHLPTEISGRGVRYAEAETAGETRANTEEVVRRHDSEIKRLHRVLMKLDKERAGSLREID
jgi:hypothetical protein